MTMSNGDRVEVELDPEAEMVALRLAAGESHAEAAMSIGRSAKWVQRRLGQDPAFRERVDFLKVARVEQASAGLGALLERAIDAIERNLDAPRPADQLLAARLVLDRSRLFRGDSEMIEKVGALAQQVAELAAEVGLTEGGPQ